MEFFAQMFATEDAENICLHESVVLCLEQL